MGASVLDVLSAAPEEIGFMKVKQRSLCCGTKLGESPCALLCIKAGRIMRKDFEFVYHS